MIISMRPFIVALGAGVLAASILTASAQQAAAPLGSLVLPAGFQADVFADKVENARDDGPRLQAGPCSSARGPLARCMRSWTATVITRRTGSC